MRKKLGERVRHLRRHRGLSQTEVAEAASVTMTFISNIERGLSGPSLDTLIAIADKLDADIDWLIGRTNRYDPTKEATSYTSHSAVERRV